MVRRSSHEQRLLEKMRMAGYQMRPVREDLPIAFFISPTTSVGLRRANTGLARLFWAEIENTLAGQKLTSSISGIGMFPTIMDPRIGALADKITYRKDGSIYLKTNIDHRVWSNATIGEQVDILAKNLRDGILQIKQDKLVDEDRVLLLRAIETARQFVSAKALDLTDVALQ